MEVRLTRRKVHSPDGQLWRVSRRWLPWRRRFKGDLDGLPDLPDLGGGDDPITGIIGLIVLIVFLPVLVVALVILGVVALELLLLLVLLPFALAGRVLFGRHWTVEVRKDRMLWWETPAGDHAASGERVQKVLAEIRRGQIPPRTIPKD